MTRTDPNVPDAAEALTERQGAVLRAIVASYVGDAQPVGSRTVSYLVPERLSSASIRNTMAELTAMGLLEKPHASAGRVPSEAGLRLFVDRLLDAGDVGRYEQRSLDHSFDEVQSHGAVRRAAGLLTDHTGQLGFVLAPRLASVKLRGVSLVRLSTERLLVLLVSEGGQVHQRTIEDAGRDDQPELEQMAALINAHVDGLTLAEVRQSVECELQTLRDQAQQLRRRALAVALRAFDAPADEPSDLVLASTVVLFDHPEFQDPDRVRELISALETRERLIEMLDEILGDQVSVALGVELEETGLRHCAVIAAPYGTGDQTVGAIGVIGPSRMDYGRIIPVVSYTSRLISQKLSV